MGGTQMPTQTTPDIDRPGPTKTYAETLAEQLTPDPEEPGPRQRDWLMLAPQVMGVLDSIPVAKRTEWDGKFDRVASFGEGWGDPDGNGCDARNDALKTVTPDAQVMGDGCRVKSGTVYDAYTGEHVQFQRGPETSEQVQIDHVVALYNAWRTGAQDLSFAERVTLANDPLNLQPTSGWVNDDKGHKDASQWLPPNGAYICEYVSRQVVIKANYRLWVTPNEHEAMQRALRGCAG